ncbi:MAG: aminopeptidase P family protein [Nitrospirae bacterium]|nr:aminopeptidase P family protein [Nitrospirota bacterium]
MLVIHYASRIAKLRDSLRGISGLLVTDIHNIRYLTGFTGSSGFLLLTKKKSIFATDFRYKEQAEKQTKGWDILIEKGERAATISKLSKDLNIKRLGFEPSVSYAFFQQLSKKGLSMKPVRDSMERLRAIKDEEEIVFIKKAVSRAESAFLNIKDYIREGMRENRIERMLEESLKKAGCNCLPFDIIVASGKNSSMPHARPSEKRLNQGDLVIIDWGGEAGGYFSDMTRTLLLQGPDLTKKKEIYNTVLKAHAKAVSAVSSGKDAKKVDSAARNVIKKAGYGEFFGHGTGHGVGIQVHESPLITWNSDDVIRENMVFTIEPGIYVEGLGGLRIEDMVVVGKKKAELLTTLSRELEIL